MKHILGLIILFTAHSTFAQQDTVGSVVDTAIAGKAILQPVTITAYGQQRRLQETPAAINYITPQQLARYSSTSVLQAINATPGVRMEERSPGSYRLNIRGSSLRSPFGVRNVKIYYNDIPLTDPGGFTYFNQLGFFNIQSLQLIKGPGSSLYGAGTGGVMLINSMMQDTATGVTLMYEAGSYGLSSIAAEVVLGNKDNRSIIRYQHLGSDGYRVQSASSRDVFSWDGAVRYAGKATLETHFLYNNLTYQTPGALTLAEYENDPVSARPHTAAAMGAVESHAQIFQQNILAGFTSGYQFSPSFRNSTTLYGSYTQLTNPTIRNYTRSNEPHFGGRTTFKHETQLRNSKLILIAGAEGQSGSVLARTYRNVGGYADTLQNDDETRSSQASGFLQATLQTNRWILEAGGSVNAASVSIRRFAAPTVQQTRNYPIQVSPRLAASYRAYKNVYFYANIAEGFSPASSSELLPTGGSLNSSLTPETGWNYEVGAKGTLVDGQLLYDISGFYYTLKNAIVLRKDASGGDQYINAGATTQPGFEGNITYNFTNTRNIVALQDVWVSYTSYNFRYHNFTQLSTDLSGKQLPGVAPNTISAGANVAITKYLSINATYFYSGKIALNDANTTYSNAYHIVDIKGTINTGYKKAAAKLFAGINNLLGQKYSLGNDINAAGGRYYNAAPGINYYAGISLSYK